MTIKPLRARPEIFLGPRVVELQRATARAPVPLAGRRIVRSSRHDGRVRARERARAAFVNSITVPERREAQLMPQRRRARHWYG